MSKSERDEAQNDATGFNFSACSSQRAHLIEYFRDFYGSLVYAEPTALAAASFLSYCLREKEERKIKK